jgi:hypothetical protein
MSVRRGLALGLVGLVLVAGGATAQSRRNMTIHASAALARVNRQTVLDTTQLSGMLVGLEAGFRLGKFELRGSYAQGSVEEDGGASNDLVEGELMLGVRPLDKLLFRFGPRARSFVTPAGTLRWVFWEARVRLETSLNATGSFWSYFEGGYTLFGGVNSAEAFGGGRGLEGGLGFALGSTPLKVRVGYRIDRGALESDVRAEAVDALQISVGIGR